MEGSIDIVFWNALLYPATALFFFRKFGRINIYVLFWFFLAFLSIMSYITVSKGYYLYNPSPFIGYSFSPLCYFLYYISNFIIAWPLYSIDETKIEITAFSNNKVFRYFIVFAVVFLFAYALLRLSEVLVVVSMGYDQVYSLRHDYGIKIFNYNNFLLHRLDMQGPIFYSLSLPFVLLYFLNRLINKIGYRWFNLTMLACSFLPSFLSELARGSKGGLFFTMTSVGFFYILLAKLIDGKTKKVINVTLVIAAIFLLSYALAIQSARVGGDADNANASSIRYLGEPMLNLGDDVWNKVKENPCGERLIPELFPARSFASEDLRFRYWSVRTGINEGKFTTTFGDLYVEFGVVGGFVFLFIFCLLWKMFFVKRYKKVYAIPLLYCYFNQFCMIGAFDWNFYNPWAHFMLVLNFVFCFGMKKMMRLR